KFRIGHCQKSAFQGDLDSRVPEPEKRSRRRVLRRRGRSRGLAYMGEEKKREEDGRENHCGNKFHRAPEPKLWCTHNFKFLPTRAVLREFPQDREACPEDISC